MELDPAEDQKHPTKKRTSLSKLTLYKGNNYNEIYEHVEECRQPEKDAISVSE